jgi:hypothetical protein
MKKGIYYVPLFFILAINMVGGYIMENYFGMIGWALCLFLLSEVYYLRFIK